MNNIRIESDIGNIVVCAGKYGIDKIYFSDSTQVPLESDDELLNLAKVQIEEYLSGKRKEFFLPLEFEGTDFSIKVWSELVKIPFGETASYSDIAKRIGNPGAARAVGTACGKNPIAIVVPCHRVTGKGNIGGYAYGTAIKKRLLELEKLD